MESTSRFIAFDLGAESGRCVIGELSDQQLDLHVVHRFETPLIDCLGSLYWNVLGIYQELETGLAKAVSEFGPHFTGISVDTWGVDYVLLDPDNRLLGYPRNYRDNRTDDMMEKAAEIVSHEKIYESTGLQFLQFNTLFQLLAEQQQSLNFLEIADLFLPIPNYLEYLLCGVKKAEYTHASTTQFSDPRTRDWAWDIIDAFQYPRSIFPEIVEPETILGKILPDLAQKTGIDSDTPVIAGASHDTGAAVASVPAQGDNWAFLSSGTWSLMGIELPEPLINEQTRELNYTNEGGVEGSIRFLKNIMGLWPLQETRRYWEKHGKEYSYDELQSLAAETDRVEAWVNVNDARFLKPGDMPVKITDFLRETDQEYQEEDDWIVRCILESLAIQYRKTVHDLENLTNQNIEKLHAIGGGIQNELLNQLTADAIGKEVVTGPVEGTAVGNIGVQAIATGVVGDLESFRQIVANSFPLETYKPQNQDYWTEHEKTYMPLLEEG